MKPRTTFAACARLLCARPARVGALALGVALAVAACSDGGSGPALELAEPAAPVNLVLNVQGPGVQLKGRFTAIEAYLSDSARVLKSADAGPASARFDLNPQRAGWYEAYAWWPQTGGRGAAASIAIEHAQGTSASRLDQGVLGGQWNSLGVFRFEPSGPASITLARAGDAPLLVDAVRIRFVGEQRPELALKEPALAVAELNAPYAGRLEAWAGSAPYSFRISSGVLPPGLALDPASGAVSGIAAETGSYPFTVEVSDATGASSSTPALIEVVENAELAPPQPKSASAGSSTIVSKAIAQAGSANLGNLASIVAALPEGEWSQVSLNRFSDVWTPAALRPLLGSGNPLPSKILSAWSSVAWDSNRAAIVAYGGGHANYRGNDVYLWRAATQRWERASLPSEMKQDSLGNWNAIDGADKAPASAHTYDNTVFLPIADRVLVLGGAADSNGGHYLRQHTETASRKTGPYLFDPSRADGNKVGGSTGSHVKREGPYPEVVGGNMWSNRENFLNTASQPPSEAYVNGCSAYAEEGGKDAVYLRTRYALYRYTLHDLSNPALDSWEKVGVYWDGPGSKATCGYDPVRKLLVRTASQGTPFVFWDLNKAGKSNRDVLVKPTDPTGEFNALLAGNAITIANCGLDFDRPRGRFALWCGDGRVWMLTPPPSPSASGWTIVKQPAPVLATPNGSVGTGILGKWKYIANLDVFIGVQDSVQGNVWVYKPVGSQPPDGPSDPGPQNLPPSVQLVSPAGGSSLPAGQPLELVADASDSDGTIAKVEFFQGSTRLGEVTSAPYRLAWASPPAGSFTLTAVATDDQGAQAVSTAVALSFYAPSPGGAGSVVLQRGLNEHSQVADTYLSTYHKTLSFGTSVRFQDSSSNYSSLARFAIFQSEGGPVPNGATIESAQLSLYKYTAYDVTYGLYRVLQDWQEGAATWNQRAPSLAWAVPGANGAGVDYAASADATASVGWAPGWIEFDVTAAVQQMSHSVPLANYGWRLKALGGTVSSLKRFYTSDYASDPALRPKLSIVYR